MNIKSLLLGSAAAAVAFTGAQAADAIVIAEPEPLEYVRICDAYGTGFFYIPGTETCLRIGGEVRYQMGTSNDKDAFSITPGAAAAGATYAPASFGTSAAPTIAGTDTPGIHGHVAETWNKEARGRFFIDARSETEWGTLRGYIRVDASRGGFAVRNAANNIRTNKAFIELGGFKVGFEDSAWAFTPNAGAANYGSHSDTGLSYGYQQRNLIQYNFSGGNGFFATLSLEDDDMNSFATVRTGGGAVLLPAYSDHNLIPDVVVKVGVNQGWGAAWAAVGFDEDRTSAATATGFLAGIPGYLNQIGDSGWAAQLGAQINVPSAPGSNLRVIGYYADSANAYNGHGGQWSILGSYWHQFTPAFGASIGAQYIDSLYLPGSDIKTNIDAWQVELNTVWTPVTNFAIRTETVYSKRENLDGTLSGFVRFSRFF